jgi:hypothetical protein
MVYPGHATVGVTCETMEICAEPRRISDTSQDATLAIMMHRQADRYSISDTATVRTPETLYRVHV